MSTEFAAEVLDRPGLEEPEAGPFVLNLCSVPAPFVLPQPRSPQLVRYAFFFSRGAEGGREQCWLHMGYFQSRAEADKWREVLRHVYPLAFVTSAELTFVSADAVPVDMAGDCNSVPGLE